MRKALVLALILPAPCGAAPLPPPVQSAPPPTEPARCARLHADYDKMLRRLAASTAEGAFPGGKSPRLRATEEGSLITLSQDTAQTMASAGCTPDDPPSGERYLLAAMKCERARRIARASATPPACDMALWKPRAE